MSGSPDDDLAPLGLVPGEQVRFRRDPRARWLSAVVDGVEPDGSLALRDERGRARAIRCEDVEVSVTGPRGGRDWEPLADRVARREQLKLW